MDKWIIHRNALIVGMLFLLALMLLAFGCPARAGIYNNTGTLSEDSIGIRFALMDSLGQPVQFDTTKDWGYLVVFYPGGDSCYSDSFLIAQSDAHIEINQSAVYSDRWGTYKDAVANIDGAGLNGTYTWAMLLRDSSLKLSTYTSGEFQLLTSGDLSATVDSINKTGDIPLVTLQSDTLQLLTQRAKAIRDSLQYLVTATGFSTFNAATDSVIVDGSALASTANAISATTLAADAIGSSEIATAAIDSAAFAADAKKMVAIRSDSGNVSGGASTFNAATAKVTLVDSSASDISKAGSAADTIIAHAPHGSNWGGTGGSATIPDSLLRVANDMDSVLIMAREFINDAPHDPNYGGTSAASGSGGKSVVFYVIDTSGADDTIPSVNVTVNDAGQTAKIAGPLYTVEPGYAAFGLTASTNYSVSVQLSGYIFPSYYSVTTTSGASPDTVALQCYDSPMGTPAAVNLKRVYLDVGDLIGDSTAARNAQMYAHFVKAVGTDSIPQDTSTSEIINTEWSITAMANGRVNGRGTQIGPLGRVILDLRRTDMIAPYGCQYHFVLTYQQKTIWEQTLLVTGSATSNLMDIVASQ